MDDNDPQPAMHKPVYMDSDDDMNPRTDHLASREDDVGERDDEVNYDDDHEVLVPLAQRRSRRTFDKKCPSCSMWLHNDHVGLCSKCRGQANVKLESRGKAHRRTVSTPHPPSGSTCGVCNFEFKVICCDVCHNFYHNICLSRSGITEEEARDAHKAKYICLLCRDLSLSDQEALRSEMADAVVKKEPESTSDDYKKRSRPEDDSWKGNIKVEPDVKRQRYPKAQVKSKAKGKPGRKPKIKTNSEEHHNEAPPHEYYMYHHEPSTPSLIPVVDVWPRE